MLYKMAACKSEILTTKVLFDIRPSAHYHLNSYSMVYYNKLMQSVASVLSSSQPKYLSTKY